MLLLGVKKNLLYFKIDFQPGIVVHAWKDEEGE
jgi:hypothetical protein